MQNLADIVMGTVQYNEEGVLMSIKELCSVMTSDQNSLTEAYNRLVKLAQVRNKTSYFWCTLTSTRCHCWAINMNSS